MRRHFCSKSFGVAALVLSAVACSPAPANPEKQEHRVSGQTFEECTDKLLKPSKLLIQRMANEGVDLSKPRTVTHLLVGPLKAIQAGSKLFSERGFDILEAANGRLLLGDEVPVSDEWVSQIVPAMCSKAAEFGLTYDGWDVDMSHEIKSAENK